MRYEKLDILRGIAISMMIVFHTNYVLLNIFDISFLNFSNSFWDIFGEIGGCLFITIASISFMLGEKKYGDKVCKRYFRYSIFLGIFALLISGFTFIFIKEQLILFGILHFFSISFLLILLFRKLKLFNFIIGLIIVLFHVFYSIEIGNNYLFILGFINNSFYSADFWPLIPYFGLFLLGYSSSLFLYEKQILQKILIGEKKGFIYNLLKVAGRHSLLIYIIHVPIIIVLIFLIKY
ncbi:DUF1624 domain-containing protein [Candidatus Gracilibacteria bacterium]|nr:DUF1624 domain-containing protein [Candidatus Gracilibacteria bacterium]